jgi:hypothetical protein
MLNMQITFKAAAAATSFNHTYCLGVHNGGNDRFSARLGILTILTIGFFVYGNQNYNSIGPQKWVFRIYHHAT